MQPSGQDSAGLMAPEEGLARREPLGGGRKNSHRLKVSVRNTFLHYAEVEDSTSEEDATPPQPLLLRANTAPAAPVSPPPAGGGGGGAQSPAASAASSAPSPAPSAAPPPPPQPEPPRAAALPGLLGHVVGPDPLRLHRPGEQEKPLLQRWPPTPQWPKQQQLQQQAQPAPRQQPPALLASRQTPPPPPGTPAPFPAPAPVRHLPPPSPPSGGSEGCSPHSGLDLPMPRPGRAGSAREVSRGFRPVCVARAHGDGEEGPAEGQRTTLMLRNLPNNYTRAALLELIDSAGFAGRYDFLYFPIDFRTHAALGYAFVNLVAPADAERLKDTLDGFNKWTLPSSKVCHVSWSHPHQGLESHIERYRNSPLMHEAVPDSYRPILFKDGVRVPFPPATKKIKPPRQGTQRMLV